LFFCVNFKKVIIVQLKFLSGWEGWTGWEKMNSRIVELKSASSNVQSLLHEDLSRKIIGLSYEVMNELGIGFLESVYHKSLEVALRTNKLQVQSEVPLKVTFRGFEVGYFKADLIVEEKIIVEVKAVDNIVGEHKAQVINYLSASNLQIGLIINFGQGKVQTARLQPS
jgi:GxxExxY protein